LKIDLTLEKGMFWLKTMRSHLSYKL